MREVSKDEFFTALYADPRDIMPTIVGRYPYKSEWRDQKSHARTLFGMSEDSKYFLVTA